jgi:hypothetical protein
MILAVHTRAQKQTLDMLTIQVNDGWSEQTQPDRSVFSNYVQNQVDPVTVIVYRKVAYQNKPEQAFATSWRTIFGLADTASVPRARKLYTHDSELFYLGGAETTGPDGKGYYQLGVYLHNNHMQTIAIIYPDAKAWRTLQYEHTEKLMAVKVN